MPQLGNAHDNYPHPPCWNMRNLTFVSRRYYGDNSELNFALCERRFMSKGGAWELQGSWGTCQMLWEAVLSSLVTAQGRPFEAVEGSLSFIVFALSCSVRKRRERRILEYFAQGMLLILPKWGQRRPKYSLAQLCRSSQARAGRTGRNTPYSSLPIFQFCGHLLLLLASWRALMCKEPR